MKSVRVLCGQIVIVIQINFNVSNLIIIVSTSYKTKIAS